MEILAGRDRFTDCCMLAWKLERAAEERETTAAVLRRAAAKFREGSYLALSDVMREVDGQTYTLAEVVTATGMGPAAGDVRRLYTGVEPGERGAP